MLILYGRRRVGKTTLLNEFSKDKNPIFYTAIESKDEENLREFSRVVFEHFNPGTTAAAFASYGDVLSYISASISNNRAEERQLIIIDEYPYYQNIVSPVLHDYMGPVFETICQDYVFRKGMEGEYGYIFTRMGKWRGNDPVRHCPADIDVVGVNDADKTAVIGECKFKNEPFDKKELIKFVDRARLISPFAVTDFLIFSLGGVTDWVERQTKENPHIRVVSMEQLYGV